MRKLQLTVLLAVVGGVVALSAGVAAAAKPSAANDTVKTNVDTRVVIDVLANDHATGGEQLDPSSLNINAFPNQGNLAVTPDAKLAYTPTAGFVGVDTFSYLVCSKQTPADCATRDRQRDGRRSQRHDDDRSGPDHGGGGTAPCAGAGPYGERFGAAAYGVCVRIVGRYRVRAVPVGPGAYPPARASLA